VIGLSNVLVRAGSSKHRQQPEYGPLSFALRCDTKVDISRLTNIGAASPPVLQIRNRW